MMSKLMSIALACALLIFVAPMAKNVLAQSSGSSSTQQSTQSTQSSAPATTGVQTNKTTTTTTQTVPTTTTVTRQTGVDPLWLALGGIALLAILAIVILSMRGRSSSNSTVVHERETVVKR